MTIYNYRLISTEDSSAKYGNCEVCHKPASEMFAQSETRYFKFEHDGVIHEGQTYNKCRATVFGHQDCVISTRRDHNES